MTAPAEEVVSEVDEELELLQPDDFHHHLRDEPALEHTVPHAARAFRRVLVMPNLVPPVTTTEAALAYRERILRRVPADVPEGAFHPLMTLYLTDNTSPEEIAKAKASGHIYAVKLYPAGATTNSDFGVTDYDKIIPALTKMEELGLLLLVHGESTDQTVDVFDREQHFYQETMPAILSRCPGLRVVCEHVTSAVGAAFVEAQGPNVAATITAHHLFYNRNAIFKGGINPHYYCLPILKTEADREVLLRCALSSPKFFLGTDSAPHAVEAKEKCCGCAGCFTAHMAVELTAEAFFEEKCGRCGGKPHSEAAFLDHSQRKAALEDFVSRRGAAFYGLPISTDTRTLAKEVWRIPERYSFGTTQVRPLRAGEDALWKLRPRRLVDDAATPAAHGVKRPWTVTEDAISPYSV